MKAYLPYIGIAALVVAAFAGIFFLGRCTAPAEAPNAVLVAVTAGPAVEAGAITPTPVSLVGRRSQPPTLPDEGGRRDLPAISIGGGQKDTTPQTVTYKVWDIVRAGLIALFGIAVLLGIIFLAGRFIYSRGAGVVKKFRP